MKKFSVLFTVLIILSSLSLTSCKKKAKDNNEKEEDNLPEYYIKANIGGDDYIFENPTYSIAWNIVTVTGTKNNKTIEVSFTIFNQIQTLSYDDNGNFYEDWQPSGSFSSDNTKYEGTFSGTVESRNNSSTLEIKDGSLRVEKQ